VFGGVTSQSIDLYFSGQPGKVTVQVQGNDTLEDVAGKLSLALWSPSGTGLLGDNPIASEFAPPDLVHFNAIGSSRGTLSIATPVPGTELVIAADEDLLGALGFDVNVAAEAPVFSVTARHAASGAEVGSVVTNTGVARGLVQGVDIYFDTTMNLALDPEPNEAANTNTSFPYMTPDETPAISLAGASEADGFYLHVAPNPLVMQVGASTGQTMEMLVPAVSTETLGVAGLNVATQERASAAIGTMDQALTRVAAIQGRVGAYQNRLASTVAELDVAAENTMAAESRIRNLDYAQEIINLTRAQITAATASYALSQANLNAASVLKLLSN